jgi:hypothetical protein
MNDFIEFSIKTDAFNKIMALLAPLFIDLFFYDYLVFFDPHRIVSF